MPPIDAMGPGMKIATVPNVNKVPTPTGPLPMPFPSIAPQAMTSPSTASMKVIINGLPTCKNTPAGSDIPVTLGDFLGVLGGVISGTFLGLSEDTIGCNALLIGAMPAGNMTHPGTSNNRNTVTIGAAPSQCKVFASGR